MAAWIGSSLVSTLKQRLGFTSCRVIHSEALSSVKNEPVYPAVVPSWTAESKSAKRRRLDEYFNKIRSSEVNDKLRLLTKNQRKKYVVHPQTFAINADRWYQHLTKTAYLPGLPEKFTAAAAGATGQNATTTPSVIDDQTFSEVRSLVCHTILQENFYLKKRKPFLDRSQEHFVAPFLSNLVSNIIRILAKDNPILLESSLDFSPDVNFYWLRGERIIPRGHRSGRVEPIRFQIDDKPHCQIRIPRQLPEFLPLEANVSAEVPVIGYAPDLMPMFRKQYDNNIFIGSKVGDSCRYGHTQFHLVQDRYHRDRLIKAGHAERIEEGLKANAIASLFAWTGAQAVYQGFWCMEDLTRPFVSQAVITDGRYFSFFCYQLNTLALTVQTDTGNPRRNVSWGTDSLPLYEGVSGDRVVGLDDGVLRLLLQFLLNRPQPT
ncbi:large ribosomal subunit protein mL65 [Paramormyrops kingsleyae]|uniref:Mitochondrial ribosomal protein S30 n=1 Tax=Paramormyrops kingsleyae TaxID=1676925 RepID=A0A3B3QRT1_9TELE|nr:39S ribosomal protein S30, mitochondrial [Paramormyrops kingsleyae]